MSRTWRLYRGCRPPVRRQQLVEVPGLDMGAALGGVTVARQLGRVSDRYHPETHAAEEQAVLVDAVVAVDDAAGEEQAVGDGARGPGEHAGGLERDRQQQRERGPRVDHPGVLEELAARCLRQRD